MSLTLKNGLVLNSKTLSFDKRDLYIDNGVFVADMPTDSEILDISGKYVIPGLIDVHTHGRAGCDFNRHERIDFKKVLASYASAGTTSIMATLASDTYASLFESIDLINKVRTCERGTESAKILGIHLEGRYLNPKKRGAHDEKLLAKPSVEELEELVFRMCPKPIHISAAPELDGGMEFFIRGTELGATMGIGHSDADCDTAKAAIAAGAVSFTHLFNAMCPVNHRAPGNACVGLTSDAYAELICDGLHIHPEMVKLTYLAKGKNKLVLITDSMEATGCPDGEYEIAGMPVTVADGKAVTHDGAIAGSLLSLFDGVINLCRFAGAEFSAAVVCATENPAKMVGVYDKVGSIDDGKSADFLILDTDFVTDASSPKIERVYIDGISVK